MRKRLLISIFSLLTLNSFSQKNSYSFTIDLVNVKDDKVQVQMAAPAIKQDEIIYYIPKIVPGTYSIDDFGRFIEDFAAFDKKGNPLPVEKINLNGWKIKNAKSLNTVSYKVNDTFDDRDSTSKKVFEPTGSNIQADTDFVINTHCFIGYFDGMKQVPYKLTINHSPELYGSTAMEDANKSTTVDEFSTNTYNTLVDNPLMYCRPDTASIMVKDSKVLISVYSPNKKVSALFLADNFNKLLQATAKYLGGSLPVKKYAFILYLDDKVGVSGSNGALEHSYSSVYYMQEGDPKALAQNFTDVAAHEFLHIITPLSIHSEEIQYFDFNAPKMSKHLWLYEGSTEYNAHISQERYGLISREDLLNVLTQKVTLSRQFFNDTVPFTVMSANVLDKYADQFINVYQKGALISACLDIKLRQLSAGKYGLINLIFDLSKKYGKDKPFKDDELFDVIGQLTYPEIKQFLLTYVSGNTPLPLEEIFALAGIDFKASVLTGDSTFTFGSVRFLPNKVNGRPVVIDVSALNDFGHQMGYRVNDTIMSINGVEVKPFSLQGRINALFKTAKVGDILSIGVHRKNDAGKDEDITLSAPMVRVPAKKLNQFIIMPNPTSEQLVVRNSWLDANN